MNGIPSSASSRPMPLTGALFGLPPQDEPLPNEVYWAEHSSRTTRGVALDITDRKAVKGALERHRRGDCRQLQRLGAFGQITSGVAHDFNNL